MGHDQERLKSCGWAAESWTEYFDWTEREGRGQGIRMSIKYVAINRVEI